MACLPASRCQVESKQVTKICKGLILQGFFQLAYFVKCKRTLLELNSYQPYPSSWREWILSLLLYGPSQNMKLGIFTGSRAVDGKESVMHVQSCCFALSSYCLFDFLVDAASLTCYYLRYIVMCQKQNILGANSIAPANSIPNVFSTHR